MPRLRFDYSTLAASSPSDDPDKDLDAIYEQYKDCETPSEIAVDILARMQCLLSEKRDFNRRQGRKLFTLLVSAVILLVGVVLATHRGVRWEQQLLRKRDVECRPTAVSSVVSVQTGTVASIVTPAVDGVAPTCQSPILVAAGQGCVLNTAALYVPCGDTADVAPISYCVPGLTRDAAGDRPFPAQCVSNRCLWPCGPGFAGASTSMCTPYTPPPVTSTPPKPSAPPASQTQSPTSPPIPANELANATEHQKPNSGACAANSECSIDQTSFPLYAMTCTSSKCATVCGPTTITTDTSRSMTTICTTVSSVPTTLAACLSVPSGLSYDSSASRCTSTASPPPHETSNGGDVVNETASRDPKGAPTATGG